VVVGEDERTSYSGNAISSSSSRTEERRKTGCRVKSELKSVKLTRTSSEGENLCEWSTFPSSSTENSA
jgi:hypothetical protein